MDSNTIKIIAQLIDSLDNASEKLEKAYNERNVEAFTKVKKEIKEAQTKLSQIVG